MSPSPAPSASASSAPSSALPAAVTVPSAAIRAYVDGALALHGWDLPVDARERVAVQFERMAEIVATLRAVALDPMHDEPAPVFVPREIPRGSAR